MLNFREARLLGAISGGILAPLTALAIIWAHIPLPPGGNSAVLPVGIALGAASMFLLPYRLSTRAILAIAYVPGVLAIGGIGLILLMGLACNRTGACP